MHVIGVAVVGVGWYMWRGMRMEGRERWLEATICMQLGCIGFIKSGQTEL